MPTLNIGVVDIPYSNEEAPKPPRITKRGRLDRRHRNGARAYQTGQGGTGPSALQTTAQVAQTLEDEYGLFTVFYNNNEQEIGAAVVHSLEGALEDLYAGAPAKDPYAEAGQEIEQGFRQFLLQGEIEYLGVPGVPTKAAIERRSGRFKSGTGPAQRPSFVDTGTMELSLRAWVD